ncbi:DNA polymerase Y family protein [Galbitalea soli]|uniref:DNA polymerase Y family protein n=1 Tax=Galbitalea soli TaxID=1268042 RepID=A0A7C9TP69_9MICO|nr:DNA polymerase Y family protein [Galbitalea soli]NEM90119.1 DNA polymerase Y family protein [Galbitalea soli]NYJ30827.1 protein ImuB [Galbitalea soli]
MSAPVLRSMVLWVPDWPVIAAVRVGKAAADAPLALIDRGIVFACSAAARAEGVKRGLRVREAQARCPALVVLPYEQQLDHRSFDAVIEAIEAVMPGVQHLRPGVCAVRVRGPARYFGGEKAAGLALLAVLDELGVAGSRVGIADGPFTAEQAARSATAARRVRVVPEGASAEFLGPLPISLIESPALVTLLRRLGITTLAEFAALPADDVLGRFGEGGAQLHALSGGLDSRPIIPRVPPDELDARVGFEPPLDRVDQVTFGVRSIADEFIQALVGHRLVCTALRVEIDTELGDYSERSWLHPRSFTASDVVDRVRWQLQGSAEVDAGLRSGVTAVRIVPEAVDAIGNHEAGLFGRGPDERVHHALSRVQSMLGHAGVVTAVVSGGRTLADRQVTVPWGDRPLLTRNPQQPWPGQLPRPAPGTVFPTPHPVHVLASDGSAVEVDSRGTLSAAPARFSPAASGRGLREITAWAGPWPVAERWWDADTARRSDRFQVVDASGVAWLLVLEAGHWSAEARYD